MGVTHYLQNVSLLDSATFSNAEPVVGGCTAGDGRVGGWRKKPPLGNSCQLMQTAGYKRSMGSI